MRKLLIAIISLCICSCGADSSRNRNCFVISDKDINSGNIVPFDSLFQLSKSLNINESQREVLGDIRDVFFGDEFIYILDYASTISQINLETGVIVKQVCSLGRGPIDYIQPVCITGDSCNVYLLDLQGGCILKYDLYLNYVSRVAITTNALDFIKMEDGFLLFCMTENGTFGFKKIKEDGAFVASYNEAGRMVDSMTGVDLIFKNTQGDIFCQEPYGDVIYKIDNNGLTDFLYVDLNRKSIGKKKPTSSLFETGSYVFGAISIDEDVILSIVKDDNMFFVYCIEGKVQAIVKSDREQIRFFYPKWEYKGKIVSIEYPTFDDSIECLSCMDNLQYILHFYELKQL